MSKNTLSLLGAAALMCAVAIWFFFKPASDSPQTKTEIPESAPEAVPSSVPAPPSEDAPPSEATTTSKVSARPEVAAHPKPTPLELKEFRPEGFRYKGTFSAAVEGKGRSDDWRDSIGGAQGHFQFTVILIWDGEVVQNDGVTLIERRKFHTARSLALFSAEQFGLSTEAVAALSQAPLLLGLPPDVGVFSVLLHREVLLEIPTLGPAVKRELEERFAQSEARPAYMIADLLSRLEGQTVDISWRNGQLQETRVLGDAFELSVQERLMASRAAAFVDFNVFPPGAREVGHEWTVTPVEIFDYFAMDPVWSSSVQGQMRLRRLEDERPGAIARVQLSNSPAPLVYNRSPARADLQMVSFEAEIHYTSPSNAGQVQYVSRVRSEGNGEAGMGMTLFDYPFLRRINVTGEPKFNATYSAIKRL